MSSKPGRIRALVAAVAALVATAVLAFLVAPAQAAAGQHAAVYYQTQYDDGRYVSPKSLTDNGAPVTDVIVGALHLNSPTDVRLNDDPVGDRKFSQMWSDLAAVQSSGVRVELMVGGAAPGSFERLDTQFDQYYPALKNVIDTYHLDGVDLDVEEEMSLQGVERLIGQLRADYGPQFTITLAPVASALSGGGNLSGFSYEDLYRDEGSDISWFNAQFYNGFGDASSTADFDSIVDKGVIPAEKISVGALTNSGNGGSGYVDVPTLQNTLRQLGEKYTAFGGVTGWEYFNATPASGSDPWQWVTDVASALG